MTLEITDDNLVERISEIFEIAVTNVSDGLTSDGSESARLFVTDNDFAEIKIHETTVSESDGVAQVNVTLSQPVDAEISVGIQIEEATADSSDFTGGTFLLTLLPGETQKTISVPLLDDSSPEGTEAFVAEVISVQSDRDNVGVAVPSHSQSFAEGFNIRFSPDGRYVVYSSSRRGGFFSTDLQTGTVVRLSTFYPNADLRITGDGFVIYRHSWTPYVSQPVTGGPARSLYPRVESDSTIDSLQLTPDERTAIIVLTGWAFRKSMQRRLQAGCLSCSEGLRAVRSSMKSPFAQLTKMSFGWSKQSNMTTVMRNSLAGGFARSLYADPGRIEFRERSPDGQSLLLRVLHEAGGGDLLVLNLQDGSTAVLNPQSGYSHSPVFTPDSQYVVFDFMGLLPGRELYIAPLTDHTRQS